MIHWAGMSSTDRTLKGAGYCKERTLPKGPNGRNLCRWCQQEVPPGKRTFCGPDCVHEWLIRSDPSYAAQQVLARDKGICVLCGRNCVALYGELRRLMRDLMALRAWGDSKGLTGDRNSLLNSWADLNGVPRGRLYGKRLWDMDHATPVIEGGGSCGLDNLRTLCIPCHRAQTRELAGRRAAQKRASKVTPEP